MWDRGQHIKISHGGRSVGHRNKIIVFKRKHPYTCMYNKTLKKTEVDIAFKSRENMLKGLLFYI